ARGFGRLRTRPGAAGSAEFDRAGSQAREEHEALRLLHHRRHRRRRREQRLRRHRRRTEVLTPPFPRAGARRAPARILCTRSARLRVMRETILRPVRLVQRGTGLLLVLLWGVLLTL